MAITITGANGNVVSLGDATGRVKSTATGLQTDINSKIAAGTAEAFDLSTNSGDPTVATGVQAVGIIQESGTYQLPTAYDYLVVADDTDTATGAVTLNSNGFTSNVKILAGRMSGITYNASTESGTIANTVGNLTFNGSGKTGAWIIYTGDGDSTITTTDANNQINTGTGKNTITLGTGNNSVYSQGQDTITGGGDGYQSITLTGSQSLVNMNDNVLMTNAGTNNVMSFGSNATVAGGSSSTITYRGGIQNEFNGAVNATVSATNGAYLNIIHGTNNTFTVGGNTGFFNGTGTTSLTTEGQLVAFGASDSEYTFTANGDASGLFVADKGNETLNASASTANMQIYAYTVSGATSGFVATGGSGSDTLVAGTGNSTFTGGAGDNLFMFTKDTSQNGTTVIKDFANSSGNKIALNNYGLDNDSLATLLQNSKNDTNGNAVLNLDGHTVTVEGVSVSDLNTSRFELITTPTQTA